MHKKKIICRVINPESFIIDDLVIFNNIIIKIILFFYKLIFKGIFKTYKFGSS